MRPLVIIALVGCSSSSSPAPKPEQGSGSSVVVPPVVLSPDATPSTCIADGLGPLVNPPEYDPSCRDGGESCEARCARGDRDGCVSHAYDLQRAGQSATLAFSQGCRLGYAVACTNLGASLWLNSVSDEDHACARRLFERACEVREQFGCGMIGRMMAHDAKTPEEQQRARAHFEKTCADLGAMSCRMYAHHLEEGELGDFTPAKVKVLMHRACATGDEDACGHDSAAETFR